MQTEKSYECTEKKRKSEKYFKKKEEGKKSKKPLNEKEEKEEKNFKRKKKIKDPRWTSNPQPMSSKNFKKKEKKKPAKKKQVSMHSFAILAPSDDEVKGSRYKLPRCMSKTRWILSAGKMQIQI